ncbi:zinc finger protein 497-like isoform X2 [Myripristis murdjan]|uniref:zinc finger protein 497-like isoform X2 n=1 Tax=Myripristis murdjan TaxID=586833 RepID=UPI0011761697|nr:zinc finger protein 497-like isoform X2 [Myripristis murdjan]
MGPSLPLSSLRLLVPPLRLLSAAMWQVARRQSVRHYGMLEDFITMVTEAVPHLVTERQRSLLLLALRAKVTLCDSETQTLQTQLDRIQAVAMATTDLAVAQWCSALADRLRQNPADRQRLLQEVFDQSFDLALQSLLSDFLSRLDQLFPVPGFKQAASWLDSAPAGLEDCLQEADREELKALLANQSCRLGQVTRLVGSAAEDALLSAWSRPSPTKPTNPCPPADTADQSEHLTVWVSPAQQEVELAMEEVVETQEVEPEAVIGPARPSVKRTEEVGGAEGVVTPLNQEEERGQSAAPSVTAQQKKNDSDSGGPTQLALSERDRLTDSPEHSADQPEHRDTADQSEEPTPFAIISHNAQRVAHKCPQCGKCFIYRSQVIRHLRTHKSRRPALRTSGAQQQRGQSGCHGDEPRPPRAHSCFQCGADFRSRAELTAHQRSHRSRPLYQCCQCDRRFRLLSSLTNHKQTHAAGGGFSCSKCEQVFESARERDAHRQKHRLPSLPCPVCGAPFSSQARLLRHLQTHPAEGAEPRYTCRFCELTFTGVTQLRIHQRSHTPRSFRCEQCHKAFGTAGGLQAHRASHSAERRFLCSHCGKCFRSRDGLEGHQRTHTGERPHRCPHCPKAFTALAGLNVHVRRHTGERPYVCTVCGKGWPSGGDLQKHMRTHTGEKPYTCQDCGKAFSISCHLTEHRRTHTGEKPFTCPECGKALRRKFDLNKHLLSHSDTRPFTCSHCPKSYTRRTHLTRHLLTHTPDPPPAHTHT